MSALKVAMLYKCSPFDILSHTPAAVDRVLKATEELLEDMKGD